VHQVKCTICTTIKGKEELLALNWTTFENIIWTPLLLSLKCVVNGAPYGNLKHILVDGMVLFDDLCQETIASKLITFGSNGGMCFKAFK